MAWHDEMIPADLTVEHGGQQIPAREIPFVKETPDFPTFLKRSIDNHRAIGSSIRLPSGEKPEEVENWRKEHLPKLQKAGIVPAPPEKYEIKRPDNLPEGAWNEGLEQEAQSWAKKHGLSQDALNDGFGLYLKALGPLAEEIQRDHKEAESNFIKEMTARGKDPVQVAEAAKRWADQKIKNEKVREKLFKSGLADDPDFALLLADAWEASGSDDTRNANTNSTEGDSADYEEARRIKFDPNHPQWKDYQNEPIDGPLHQKVDAAYKKKFGTNPMPLG